MRQATIANLKKYLAFEANERHGIQVRTEDIVGIHSLPPQQPNHCDCGVYLLKYVQSFFANAQKNMYDIYVCF